MFYIKFYFINVYLSLTAEICNKFETSFNNFSFAKLERFILSVFRVLSVHTFEIKNTFCYIKRVDHYIPKAVHAY